MMKWTLFFLILLLDSTPTEKLTAFGCLSSRQQCPEPTIQPTTVIPILPAGKNLAASGESKQSSTSGSSESDLALDDNNTPSSPVVKPVCMIIKEDGDSSFYLNLKGVFIVRDITLVNSKLQGDLDLVAIMQDMSADNEEVTCRTPAGVVAPGITELPCDEYLPKSSRVKFELIKKSENNRMFISICEVDVRVALENFNIAQGKPTLQSSTYPGNDAKYGVDGDISTVAHSTNHDRFPWWRVDLLKSHIVRKVAIYGRPLFEQRFHDVDIIVSDEDISQIPLMTVFSPSNSSICVDKIASEKAIGVGWTDFFCKQVVVGRYVSIQITADCKPGRTDCNRSDRDSDNKHVLHMMEVEVVGQAWEGPSDKYELENVAPNNPTKQSSTDGSLKASLAVDGDYKTFQSTAVNGQFAWWQVDLRQSHLVSEVIVYIGDGEERLQFHDVTIRVSNKDISRRPDNSVFDPKDDSVCAEDIGTGGPIPSGKNVFTCTKPLIGRFVSLQIVKNCKEGWGSDQEKCNGNGDTKGHVLHMAEVEVKGVTWKYENILLRGSDLQLQDTNYWHEFNKKLALDGNKKEDIMTIEDNATCATTDIYAADQFPWWSVDLKKESTVKQVIINNRGPPLDVLLHDIQIRVGNTDIGSGHNSDKVWDTNPLCAQRDGFLQPGKNEINCEKVLKGRFVSIQITKKCTDDKCYLYDTNVLSLCDVQVYGEE